MWINTRIFEATTNKGWWALVRNPEIRFDLEFDGSKLTHYGYKMLQYWGTRGFCYKPTGEMAARWEVLMYKHAADYIATYDGGNLTLRYMNPDAFDAVKVKLKEYEALLKLASAAASNGGNSQWYQLYPGMDAPQYDLLKVPHTKRRTVAEVRGTIRGPRNLLDALVRTIGHPLGDRLPAYLNDMRSTFSFPAVASQVVNDRVRRTTTRILR